MTKYMKITRTRYGTDLYIDLHKINRIAEEFRRGQAFCLIHVPQESDKALRDYVNDAGYFSTQFSIPGERNMEVFGPAKEFITHIEEQQKRARKGKEIEPYKPDGTTVYTSAGKVHGINDLLEPAQAHQWHDRELNSQTADYIRQIIGVKFEVNGYLDGRYHPWPRIAQMRCIFDHQAVIDLWAAVSAEVEEGTLSIDNYRLIHKAVHPIVIQAVQHQRELSAA
tara:strand:- start:1872 stop:2543 length:672 start_codon:yes stop_codon:yes gene_type:complete